MTTRQMRMVGCSAERQSSSGSSVRPAESDDDRLFLDGKGTVDWLLRARRAIGDGLACFHFATVFLLILVALGGALRLLTILYRSTDRLRRRGAAV